MDTPTPTLELAVELARQAAREFGVDRGLRQGEVVFRLARRLWTKFQGKQIDQMLLRPALEVFLDDLAAHRNDSMHGNRDDAWVEFLYAWDKVRVPEGQGVLEVAFERAKAEPIVPIQNLGDDFATVASVAYHLQRLQGDDADILLPVVPLGKHLNKTPMHVSRIVYLVRKSGLIEEVDGEFSYREGKAKTYRFLFDSGKYTVGSSNVESGAGENDASRLVQVVQ